MLAVAAAGTAARAGHAQSAETALYDVTPFGNVSLMHITDTHAQLLPIYFREPNINIGVAGHRRR